MQRLKPISLFLPDSARLKACPDTNLYPKKSFIDVTVVTEAERPDFREARIGNAALSVDNSSPERIIAFPRVFPQNILEILVTGGSL
jgi:hypothetical protein